MAPNQNIFIQNSAGIIIVYNLEEAGAHCVFSLEFPIVCMFSRILSTYDSQLYMMPEITTDSLNMIGANPSGVSIMQNVK
jgi:hypothetical protein